MRRPFLLLLALLALAGCSGQSQPDKESAVLVDFAKYRAVRPGMTIGQVEDLLQASGDLDDVAAALGKDRVVYRWRNDTFGRTGMSAYFVKGKLVEKRSIGNLR